MKICIFVLFFRKFVYFIVKGSLFNEIFFTWASLPLFGRWGGGGRATATYMVQTNLFSEKKKKIKIVDFVKYCVVELTYIVMIVGWYSFLCSFLLSEERKKKKSYVMMYVKVVRRVIKSRHCLYILYFVLLLSVIGFDFCHFLGS